MIRGLRFGRRRDATLVAAAVLGAALVAGCGGSSPVATPGTSTAQATPSAAAASTGVETTAPATPASTGPATYSLTVAGDPNVTGSWSASVGVNCRNPSFDGPDIVFFAQSPDTQAIALVTLTADSISVSERHGSGAEFTDREFAGTGVTGFDPARGATFDGDVAEVPSPGQKPGALGAISHVSGSVDCGGQTPGSSTVVASGASPEGPMSGAFDQVRVGCFSSDQNGDSVTTSAVIHAGTTLVNLVINLPSNHNATIFTTTPPPGAQHTYTIAKDGQYTLSKTGGHVDADFVELVAQGSGATPHTIHLAGDLTCGTNGSS